MSRRDPALPIRQMIDHAREAVALVRGRARSDLEENRVLELAVVRLLEIVGEAANRVPKSQQAKFSDVPWPEIVGLRNRLIHGYDAVDLDIVWQVLKVDLPDLIERLERSRTG